MTEVWPRLAGELVRRGHPLRGEQVRRLNEPFAVVIRKKELAAMVRHTRDLWELVRGQPEIDPGDLAAAVATQARQPNLDYRTRLLIRDSVEALKDYWGSSRAEHWLSNCDEFRRIQAIGKEEFDKVGFPSIRKRLMDKTDPETIRQYFTQIGLDLRMTVAIVVGGSCALILPGYISRFTEDIDVVGEIPEEIRTKYQLLEDLERLHGLHLGHVQSHYFPWGWQDRVYSHGVFDHLRVSLVDVYDVFLGKLFSNRLKDMGDLKVLLPQLAKDVLIDRLSRTCGPFVSSPPLKEIAEKNWLILFGDELPT